MSTTDEEDDVVEGEDAPAEDNFSFAKHTLVTHRYHNPKTATVNNVDELDRKYQAIYNLLDDREWTSKKDVMKYVGFSGTAMDNRMRHLIDDLDIVEKRKKKGKKNEVEYRRK